MKRKSIAPPSLCLPLLAPRPIEGQHLRVYPRLRNLAPEPEFVRPFQWRRVVVNEVLAVVEGHHRREAGISARGQVEYSLHPQRLLVNPPERRPFARQPVHDLVSEALPRRREKRPALVIVAVAPEVAAAEYVDLVRV